MPHRLISEPGVIGFIITGTSYAGAVFSRVLENLGIIPHTTAELSFAISTGLTIIAGAASAFWMIQRGLLLRSQRKKVDAETRILKLSQAEIKDIQTGA